MAPSRQVSVWLDVIAPPWAAQYDLIILDTEDRGTVSCAQWQRACPTPGIKAGNDIALFDGSPDGGGTLYSACSYARAEKCPTAGLNPAFAPVFAGNLDPEVACFVTGTRIATPDGERRIEDLEPGDAVLCDDGKMTPVRWTGRKRICPQRLSRMPHLRPVRIGCGALGNGLPERDLLISACCTTIVRASVHALASGDTGISLRTRDLLGMPGVRLEEDCDRVEYAYFGLGRESTFLAEGVPFEALFIGRPLRPHVAPPPCDGLPVLLTGLRQLPECDHPACVSPNLHRPRPAVARAQNR